MKSRWTLAALTWPQFAMRLWLNESDVFGRAAQLSYYFLLAIVPMILCLTTISGFIMGSHSGVTRSLFEYLSQLMPPAAFELVKAAIIDIRKGSSGSTLSLGLLATLWAASSGVEAIGSSLNAAYGVKETRPWYKTKLLAIGLTLAFASLTIFALILVLYGGKIGEAIEIHFKFGSWFDILWKIAQYPVVIAFILLALALAYYLTPNLKHRKWSWVTPGSVVATGLWLIASLLFRLYLHFFDTYSRTYGSLGAVIVLMLWLYMTSVAILLGGRINSEIDNAISESPQKNRERPPTF